jgi:hypothetical protein
MKRLLRAYCAVRMSQPARLALIGYVIIGGLGALLGVPELFIAALLVGLINWAQLRTRTFVSVA